MKTTYERVLGRFHVMKKGEPKLSSEELRIMIKAVCEEFDSMKDICEENDSIKSAYIRSQHKKVDIEVQCPYCSTVKNVTWNDDVEINQEKCNKCNEQFMIVKE